MTDSPTRPTPGLLAGPRTGTPPYSRSAWEQAVMAGDLPVHARLLAFVLAHHAGDSGHIPPGHVQDARNLAPQLAMSGKLTRISLSLLLVEGYISRPPIDQWRENLPRPVTLTLPLHAVTRREPPHPGSAA